MRMTLRKCRTLVSSPKLDPWFDVAVFTETGKPLAEVTPLYSAKQRLRSGQQVLTVRTAKKLGIVALDPFHKMLERSAGITV
jgi:hypothetical protein